MNHLRLVLGTSMGGMHTWMWGYTCPDFMDALVPLACVPDGHRGAQPRLAQDADGRDPRRPGWNGRRVRSEPPVTGLRTRLRLLVLMGAAPLQWQKNAPTRDAADAFLEAQMDAPAARRRRQRPALPVRRLARLRPLVPPRGRIEAPVLAINSADDLINPPELGLMESCIPRVGPLRYVLLRSPTGPAATHAHLGRGVARSRPGGAPGRAGERGERGEARERELIRAIGSGDLAAYERLVADDYVALRGSGDQTKAQVMEGYKAGSLAYRDLAIEDVTVSVFGEVAVLSALTTGLRIENGQESPNRVRYLRVWARRDGSWRAVVQMAVPVPVE